MLRRGGAKRQAGVVDQHVDAAEAFRQRGQRGVHRGGVAHVETGRVHVGGPQFVDQRLQAFAAAAGGHHLPAGGDEAARGRQAETGRGAGDEGGPGHHCLALIAIAGRPLSASFCLASASSPALA